jgi:Fe2+ or Zn2+ uptake regulation protein
VSELYKSELVFECNTCGAIHDPCTTNFTLLLHSAKELGWRIKWLDSGYQVTCANCAKE